MQTLRKKLKRISLAEDVFSNDILKIELFMLKKICQSVLFDQKIKTNWCCYVKFNTRDIKHILDTRNGIKIQNRNRCKLFEQE